MPGLKLVVPTAFTDTSLPKLRDDPMLPDTGALLLVEPAHPANPLVGNPASGATIPNIALTQAQAMIPTGTATTLAAILTVGSTFDAAGLRERTTKGGLHVVSPQASAGDANRYVVVTGAALVRDYIGTNTTHAYFASLWCRRTRAGVASAANGVAGRMTNSGGYAWIFYSRAGSGGDTEYPTDSHRLGHRAIETGSGPTYLDLVPFLHNIAVSLSYAGATSQELRLCGFGNVDVASATYYGQAQSKIFYRSYIEDLTVSGRNYATVDALDYAEFTKQCLTAGGRYYGDTYTNPTTIP